MVVGLENIIMDVDFLRGMESMRVYFKVKQPYGKELWDAPYE